MSDIACTDCGATTFNVQLSEPVQLRVDLGTPDGRVDFFAHMHPDRDMIASVSCEACGKPQDLPHPAGEIGLTELRVEPKAAGQE
jgi:hypothetical protein